MYEKCPKSIKNDANCQAHIIGNVKISLIIKLLFEGLPCTGPCNVGAQTVTN